MVVLAYKRQHICDLVESSCWKDTVEQLLAVIYLFMWSPCLLRARLCAPSPDRGPRQETQGSPGCWSLMCGQVKTIDRGRDFQTRLYGWLFLPSPPSSHLSCYFLSFSELFWWRKSLGVWEDQLQHSWVASILLYKPRSFPVCSLSGDVLICKRSPSRSHFMWWSEQGQRLGLLQLFFYKQTHRTGMVKLPGVKLPGMKTKYNDVGIAPNRPVSIY